ncbi:MAG: SAM-dependent methyltransferase [Magnetococcus sp. MYC-9]
MGQPARFQVVEAGAGSGKLAADVCRTARRFPAFQEALRYTLLEISPDFHTLQQHTLAEAGIDAQILRWRNSPTELAAEGIEGVLLSNEFFDALPVHWLEMTADGLREIGVALEENRLTQRLLPLSPPMESDYFARRGLELPIGMRTEVGLAACDWMAEAARHLKRGVILSIDYGYTQEAYYHSGALPQGTLCGFYQHRQIHDPLLHPGEMDLTAHVNFTALAQAGQENGLTTLGYTTQAWFLLGLGLLQRLEQLLPTQNEETQQRLRQSVQRLIMPQAMGDRFKVLAQGKGLDDQPPLTGFSLRAFPLQLRPDPPGRDER